MLQRIDFTKNYFEANGKTYRIVSELSIERYIMFERLEAEAGFGLDFAQIFNQLKKAYEFANKGKLADVSVTLHNLMTNISRNLDNRLGSVFKYATLFLVTDDEDLSVWSEELAEAKVNDWRKEGINAQDFFTLAFNTMNGYMEAYKEISQSYSQTKKDLNNTSDSE